MDYKLLLDQKNLITFLKSIISKENNLTIITSAKEIIFHLQGNNNIPSKFYYNELYKKYKFKLEVVNSNGLKVQLFSFSGDKIKYIGQTYSGNNPNTQDIITKKPTVSPTPTPTPTPTSNFYLVDDLDNYLITDNYEYLFIQNDTNGYLPDPS